MLDRKKSMVIVVDSVMPRSSKFGMGLQAMLTLANYV